jgi:hypothetical protein
LSAIFPFFDMDCQAAKTHIAGVKRDRLEEPLPHLFLEAVLAIPEIYF